MHVLLRFKSKAPHTTDCALPELHPSTLFIYSFVTFCFFGSRSSFAALAVLGLVMEPRLASNSQQPFCLSLQSAGLMDTYLHA